VVILSIPSIDNSTVQFFNRNHIDVVFVENTVKDSGIPMSEDMAYAALTLISDKKNLPLLIVCKSGKNLTGVVTACLRKMQRWSLISIYEEFRRYAAGWLSLRSQQQLEQFIELFDTDPIPFDSSTAPAFLNR
jgi:tyrosine-protein phosphatase SIW14